MEQQLDEMMETVVTNWDRSVPFETKLERIKLTIVRALQGDVTYGEE